MKKLLSSAAICGLAAFVAVPAHAAAPATDGLKLDIGGYFKGYATWLQQDKNTAAGVNVPQDKFNHFDILRDTEVHLGGETTLDNGLTVGAHFEMQADGNYADSFNVQESYLYMSGGWGRVNLGAEDGAAYLLQVETPSADSNFDGLRQFVQPINYGLAGFGVTGLTSGLAHPAAGATIDGVGAAGRFTGVGAGGAAHQDGYLGGSGLDYDQDLAGYQNKFTYLSPILNGFQVGASFTPDVSSTTNGNSGVGVSNDGFGRSYDIAARYEGQFDRVGVILGAGYSRTKLNTHATTAALTALNDNQYLSTDDQRAWNAGADFDIGPFGIGAAYVNTDYGLTEGTATAATVSGDHEKIWNFGADYTTGPFKFGATYYHNDNVYGINDLNARRYTGGVVYTYGPGMTFRGTVSHVKFDNTDTALGTPDDKISATDVMLGTQVNF